MQRNVQGHKNAINGSMGVGGSNKRPMAVTNGANDDMALMHKNADNSRVMRNQSASNGGTSITENKERPIGPWKRLFSRRRSLKRNNKLDKTTGSSPVQRSRRPSEALQRSASAPLLLPKLETRQGDVLLFQSHKSLSQSLGHDGRLETIDERISQEESSFDERQDKRYGCIGLYGEDYGNLYAETRDSSPSQRGDTYSVPHLLCGCF